jgi:hypothetical protein
MSINVSSTFMGFFFSSSCLKKPTPNLPDVRSMQSVCIQQLTDTVMLLQRTTGPVPARCPKTEGTEVVSRQMAPKVVQQYLTFQVRTGVRDDIGFGITGGGEGKEATA